MIKQNLPNGIYLDWNIFQDIKLSRKNGLQLKQCINTLKYKRLVFPYSYSHIRDLSRSNEKYYEEMEEVNKKFIAVDKIKEILEIEEKSN